MTTYTICVYYERVVNNFGDELREQLAALAAMENGARLNLLDVSSIAKEAGFRIPVAVTSSVWHDYITPDPRAAGYQDIDGRLWDILWMLSIKARQARQARGARVMFSVLMIMKARQRRYITFRSVIGAGDDGEPVITIMTLYED